MAQTILAGDTSGTVTLQAPAVAGSTVITLPATSGTALVNSNATNVLAEAQGGTGTTTGYYGFKNRIINGAMMIDQRNNGSSVTPTSTSYVSCDRWYPQLTQASKFSVQQQSSVVPSGFSFAQKFAVVSTVSAGAGDYFGTEQRIEGFNLSDLDYGLATAKTTTLSFYAYANNAGTYCGSVYNPNGSTRSFVFSFALAANTWTYVTITVAGDTTTGTVSTTNGQGLSVRFALTVGSNFSTGTTNAWVTGNYATTSGAFNWMNTSGSTFYITGVQLEKGSTATSFDYRPYGTELMLCQRYYEQSYDIGTTAGYVGANSGYLQSFGNQTATAGALVTSYTFKTTKRISGSSVLLWDTAGNSGKCTRELVGTATYVNQTAFASGVCASGFSVISLSGTAASGLGAQWTVNAEL